MATKVATYQQAGVPLIWVVWPGTPAIDVWQIQQGVVTLGKGDFLDGLFIIPGFRCPVQDIFNF